MSIIKENIDKIQKTIQALNPHTQLLVATKYAGIEEIQEVIDCGITLLGENKVQDAEKKILTITTPNLSWHLLGHLQSNKVNKAVSLFDCIQSVDSLALAEKIDQAAKKIQKVQKILIQINIGNEAQKSGFSLENFLQSQEKLLSLHNLEILGIMVIVPHTKDEEELRSFFGQTKKLFDQMKEKHPHSHVLSMGMSEDFKIAIEEGSTLVRVGRSIFKP